MQTKPELTPMMAHYRQIKSELPADALLLFRLGDFYELFFEDAEIGSKILNVTLTRRGSVKMCGIPFHARQSYFDCLLKAGKRIAICDVIGDVKPGQTVKREVVLSRRTKEHAVEFPALDNVQAG